MRMLKGAIIGFGEVARNGHWPGYAASGEVEIVAVVDRSAGRRKLAQESLPGVATFSSIAGGVVLMDHGWHAIYLARQWFGTEPTDVRATLHRTTNAGAEDEATLTLVFPGGQAKIFVTWRADVRRNTMRLVGELGAIT